jgi:hypothetical protein
VVACVDGGASVDTLHMLHCLVRASFADVPFLKEYLTSMASQNTIRKHLDTEHYSSEFTSYSRVHVGRWPSQPARKEVLTLPQDHCMDQIRQSIQCFGDFTPIPTKWYPVVGGFVVTDRKHTCRNFSKLQTWAAKRFHLTEWDDVSKI